MIMLAGAIAVVLWVSTRPLPALEGWGDDYEAALQTSAQTERPILISFYQDSCPPCRQMHHNVLPDEKVAAALQDFVPVSMDINKEWELANRYSVRATPTFVIVDGDGSMVAREVGFLPVEKFISFLEHASH